MHTHSRRDHDEAEIRGLAARDLSKIVEPHGDLTIVVQAHQDGVCRHLQGAHDAPPLWRVDCAADRGSAIAEAPIHRMFKGETATQASTQARDPTRVDREILILRHSQRDALLMGGEARTTEHIATEAIAPGDPRTIAWAELPGLDAETQLPTHILRNRLEVDALL